MLTHPTLDLLHSLGLHDMAKALRILKATPKPEASNILAADGKIPQ